LVHLKEFKPILCLPDEKLSGGHLIEGYLVATKLKNLVVKDVMVFGSHRIETYVVAIDICFLMFFLCPLFFVGFPPHVHYFFFNFSNDPCYFMYLDDGHFDGGHVSDESGESTSKDSSNWDKSRSYFDLGGNQRIVVQLFRQLDGIELHYR
jgi:hypothetical protein